MTRAEFEALVRRMTAEIPPDYFDGITEVTVSPRAVPHPTRAEIYTLGECIPLPLEGSEVDAIQSRVVLYHGSFAALAELDPEFDWEDEAWDTLTHELRHHVEWRARRDDLEVFDRVAEQNFARQDGEPFDPLFFLDGESTAPGVYHVEDDWFIDLVVREIPRVLEFSWHGRSYAGEVPPDATLPAYLVVDRLSDPPPGELVLVVRRRSRFTDLFRPAPVYRGSLVASPLNAREP